MIFDMQKHSLKKSLWWPRLDLVVLATCIALSGSSTSAFDARGGQFIALKSFSHFEKSTGANHREIVLTSPEIVANIHWKELIPSWDAEMPDSTYLKIEARAVYSDRTTPYYTMALWSGDPALHPRESVPNQKDGDGKVSTDTLILNEACDRLQVRLTMGSDDNRKLKLKFLSLCLTAGKEVLPTLPPNRLAWGRTLSVPERSQMAYPNGNVLCSPTTVSMIMTYWAQKLNRPEMDRDVPEVVKGVYDMKWDGAGNWPFNMAYAGSYHGMRAYVTRMSDVSELEDWIADGIPVGLSLCYNKLRGRDGRPSGHLVVCVGFTDEGDVIINDPGTTLNVRKTFPRKNLIAAWAYSQNAAYMIYPEDSPIPTDRFGHWDSWSARQRIKLNR
ncbi:MAG: hypothetical protein QOJ40_676 [Verrucomicrobiota bacterium]